MVHNSYIVLWWYWYHFVVHFDVGDLTSGGPRLWLNGVEIAGTGYSAVGGSATTINSVEAYIDDGAAMQDLVLWNKLLNVLKTVLDIFLHFIYLPLT